MTLEEHVADLLARAGDSLGTGFRPMDLANGGATSRETAALLFGRTAAL